MHSRRSAFTLVELSIVLVIVGLVVGGILGGQSLIQAHKVRNVLTDAKTYAIAMQQFKDKYDYFPGDFPTATNVWGSDAAACSTGNNLTPGTCNGDGNNVISVASAASTTAEVFQMWKQMALAGLITGAFTGINGPAGANYDSIPGTNIPRGPINNTGFWLYNWGYQAASTTFYEGDYTNTMTFGGAITGDWPHAAALSGKEAAEIDKKADDGIPAFGTIRTLAKTWMSTATGECASSDTASVATYVLTPTAGVTHGCCLLFLNTFMTPQQ